MKIGDMTYNKILEEGVTTFEMNVRTTCQVCSLLEKDGFGAIHLTDINHYFLRE